MLHLKKEAAIEVANKNDLDLRDYEITGQSLLTRDAEGNWKFAHKSILEFFLAKECAENSQFASSFGFTGMDMAERFYKEMLPVYYGITFVKVEGGTFKMGDEHEGFDRSRPVHRVSVPDFYIGKAPVTQKQWRDVMGRDPLGLRFRGCDDCPVENVSWIDVHKFIEKLSAKTGRQFRLPTEAEWEYAACGGHESPLVGGTEDVHIGKFIYAGSNNLDEVGWYDNNSNQKTHPVVTKKPNELGLYDMSGNVLEWCQDKWHGDYKGAPTDGTAWGGIRSSYRVVRGGSWHGSARLCRSANRGSGSPGSRAGNAGFRLVFVP